MKCFRFGTISVVCALVIACPMLDRPTSAQDTPEQTSKTTETTTDPPINERRPLSAAEQRCFELLHQLNENLSQLPRFELKLKNQVVVKSNTANETEDQLRQTVMLTMKVDHTDSDAAPRIQLLMNVEGDEPDFVIDWHEWELTRIFLPEKIYSQTTTRDLRHDLRQCQFTADNLIGAHGDFLLRSDLVEHVRHQVVHLTDVSEDEDSPHFHLELADGREIELWFSSRDGMMIPVKLESHQIVALGENQLVDVVSSGEFSWELSPGEIQWMSLPKLAELRRVTDLRNEMMRADSADRLTMEIPSERILDMSGAEVDTANELKDERKPTLLYFWATWAAPSLREIEGVQKFAMELEASGIRVHPVNVGESQETVREFQQAKEIAFPIWRDPEAKLCTQLGILHLPAAVIVDEGKVVTILENVGENNRDQIRETLTKLASDQ